jgi:hypothetical protein
VPVNEKRELRERNSLHEYDTILVEFVKSYFVGWRQAACVKRRRLRKPSALKERIKETTIDETWLKNAEILETVVSSMIALRRG